MASNVVANVLSGLSVLAFLEQVSAAAKQQHHPRPLVTDVAKRSHPRKLSGKRKRSKSAKVRALTRKQHVCLLPVPHVFALPSSSLPSRPGQFDGRELVQRLLALQRTKPLPDFECQRTISNSTYLRRLFICAHMAPLFPSPVDRKSFMSSISNGNGSASSSSGAWPSPPLPQPTCSSSSSASAPPPSSSSSLLCAASLASLVASDVTKYSRIQETVAERSFRQRRAAAGEGGTGAGGGSNSDFIFDVPAARAAPAAPPAFLSALALASAAAAGPVPRVASYEAVPQLDPQGRAFCVVIEWLRSTTSKKEFLWKGRLSKGWDAVCTANRFQLGHDLSFKLWFAENAGGSNSDNTSTNDSSPPSLAFVVVGRQDPEGSGGRGGFLGGGVLGCSTPAGAVVVKNNDENVDANVGSGLGGGGGAPFQQHQQL